MEIHAKIVYTYDSIIDMHGECMYVKRSISSKLIDYMDIFPVLAITGPRQAGKSTLLQNALPDYRYVSFDDYRIRSFISNDPVGFMEQYNDKVIFDEAQKEPEIFNLIKLAV